MAKKNFCTAFPDKSFLGDYTEACKNHDRQYQFDVKQMTREQADLILFEQAKEKATSWYNFWVPYYMYYGVSIFCKPAWQRWKYYWFLGFIPIPRWK